MDFGLKKGEKVKINVGGGKKEQKAGQSTGNSKYILNDSALSTSTLEAHPLIKLRRLLRRMIGQILTLGHLASLLIKILVTKDQPTLIFLILIELMSILFALL